MPPTSGRRHYHWPIVAHRGPLLLLALLMVAVASACGGGTDGDELETGPSITAAVDTGQSAPTPLDPPESTQGTVSVSTPSSTSGSSATSGAITSSSPRSSTSTAAATTASTTVSPSAGPTTTTSGSSAVAAAASPQQVRLRFESWVDDVPVETLAAEALGILNDPRGWGQAGFSFVADPDGPYRVVLAEGDDVDRLCLPLETFGTVSCQNGPVVALNADRWRTAVDHWVLGVGTYRGYLVNHEVGHLIGQRHPKPRCPVAGRPAGVMEQQTAGLEGCVGNPWPRAWELDYAARRPVVYAPLPAWAPDPVPTNLES